MLIECDHFILKYVDRNHVLSNMASHFLQHVNWINLVRYECEKNGQMQYPCKLSTKRFNNPSVQGNGRGLYWV